MQLAMSVHEEEVRRRRSPPLPVLEGPEQTVGRHGAPGGPQQMSQVVGIWDLTYDASPRPASSPALSASTASPFPAEKEPSGTCREVPRCPSAPMSWSSSLTWPPTDAIAWYLDRRDGSHLALAESSLPAQQAAFRPTAKCRSRPPGGVSSR